MARFRAFCAGDRVGGFFGAPESKSEFSLAATSNMLSVFGGCGGFGEFESPSTMFTRQYSISAMKTKLKREKGRWEEKILKAILYFLVTIYVSSLVLLNYWQIYYMRPVKH